MRYLILFLFFTSCAKETLCTFEDFQNKCLVTEYGAGFRFNTDRTVDICDADLQIDNFYEYSVQGNILTMEYEFDGYEFVDMYTFEVTCEGLIIEGELWQ